VAKAIAKLLFDSRAIGLTFHLTVHPDHLPKAQELLRVARSWAAEKLGEAPPPARFLPLQALARLPEAARPVVPGFLLSYFGEDRCFRRDNVERLLGPYVPDWEEILPQLLDYAECRGFLRRRDRTAREHVLYRLENRRLPVRKNEPAAEGGELRLAGMEPYREIGAATIGAA
jgi:hypothetical protein